MCGDWKDNLGALAPIARARKTASWLTLAALNGVSGKSTPGRPFSLEGGLEPVRARDDRRKPDAQPPRRPPVGVPASAGPGPTRPAEAGTPTWRSLGFRQA